MEKLSIVTDEISQDLKECEQFLKETKIKAVEIRVVGDRRVPYLSEEDFGVLTSWVGGGSVNILALSPGLFKCDLTDTPSIKRYVNEVLPMTIDQAKALKAQAIISFGFFTQGTKELSGFAHEAMETAAGLCANAKLELWLENEPGTAAERGNDTMRIMEGLTYPNVYANWDPANAFASAPSADLETQASALNGLLRHVHVKNGRTGKKGWEGCPLLEGAMNWRKHLRHLKGMGYSGYLSVETHCLPFLAQSTRLVKELRELASAERFWDHHHHA